MADHEQIAAFLEEAAELAVRVAHKEISIDQYVETIEKLKADLPTDHVAEAEVAIQLAGFKMQCEEVRADEEIRQCYRIAATIAQNAIAELRATSLMGEEAPARGK